nr:hypothetical protein HK105_006982 [Polyrhizophydium stewartii]
MAAGRRKRKWDVEEPEGGAPAPASDAGGSAAESAPSPAASATSGALTTNSPKPSLAAVVTALVAAEHVPKRPAPLNLRDTDSVIAATAAATSAVVAMLGKSNVQHRPDTIPSGEFSAKIEINDMRNRYLVTNATTQAKIKEETGADVVTRGKFYPDKSRATERDPPLYLFISASTQESVDKAVKAVNEIIEQASITLVEPRIPHEVRRMQHVSFYTSRSASREMQLI